MKIILTFLLVINFSIFVNCQTCTGANGSSCDDGNPCTINDICINGVCSGTPKNCDDGNPCTDDACNTTTGLCTHTNNTATCNDGDVCTVNDHCLNGACVPGTPLVCNDNNACTDDACNPAVGCVFTIVPSNIFVTSSNNSGVGSLRNVIQNSCIGDTILFNVNIVNLLTPITIPHFLIIKGNGQETTIINCGLTTQAVILPASNALLLADIKFINSFAATNGGAIINQGNLFLNKVSFQNNYENTTPKALTNFGNITIMTSGTNYIFK